MRIICLLLSLGLLSACTDNAIEIPAPSPASPAPPPAMPPPQPPPIPSPPPVSSTLKLLAISAGSGDVYVIDTTDITNPIFDFSLGAGKDFAGLAYSELRKTYFAYSRGENQLYEFNRSGVILNVIALDRTVVVGPGPRGIAFDYDGRFFMVGFDNILYEVNPDTGQTTQEFQVTGPTLEVEAIAPLDSEAFLAVGVRSQLFLLNRNTGALMNIFDAPVSDLDAMTGTIGGTIYMSDSGASSLFAYNPLTQQFDNFGSLSIPDLNGLVEVADG
jgi:DNA-binding beta-propeller fold protein YncE